MTEQSPELKKQIADALAAIRSKSFTDRNPYLGKMINCYVCGNRHYSSKVCEPVYATHDRHGDPYFEDESPLVIDPRNATDPIVQRNAIFGASPFKGKRILPHRHPVTLEILNRAYETFDEHVEFLIEMNAIFGLSEGEIEEQPDMTVHVRNARAFVFDRIDRKTRKAQRQADISRRINRGLAKPGARA